MTNDQITMILTLACIAGGIGVFAYLVLDGSKTGTVPSRYRDVCRKDRPATFWLTVAFYLLAIACLLAIAFYAIWRLLNRASIG